jgi:hypothetical protein
MPIRARQEGKFENSLSADEYEASSPRRPGNCPKEENGEQFTSFASLATWRLTICCNSHRLAVALNKMAKYKTTELAGHHNRLTRRGNNYDKQSLSYASLNSRIPVYRLFTVKLIGSKL